MRALLVGGKIEKRVVEVTDGVEKVEDPFSVWVNTGIKTNDGKVLFIFSGYKELEK